MCGILDSGSQGNYETLCLRYKYPPIQKHVLSTCHRAFSLLKQVPGECKGNDFSVAVLLVARLLSMGPVALVIDTWTHWP